MERAIAPLFAQPNGPYGRSKGQIPLKSISKIFIPNFVCVITNKVYKTYRAKFLFCRQGWDLVVLGVTNLFFRTWSCSISIDGDDE